MQQALNKHGLLPNLSNKKPQQIHTQLTGRLPPNNAIKFNQFQQPIKSH